MKHLKIIGIILLILGIIIIIWTLISSYNIFTGKTEAPILIDIEHDESLSLTEEEVQEDMERIIEDQISGMIPFDAFPLLLNLVAWSILAFILIFGGTQLSGLGIKLLKK